MGLAKHSKYHTLLDSLRQIESPVCFEEVEEPEGPEELTSCIPCSEHCKYHALLDLASKIAVSSKSQFD